MGGSTTPPLQTATEHGDFFYCRVVIAPIIEYTNVIADPLYGRQILQFNNYAFTHHSTMPFKYSFILDLGGHGLRKSDASFPCI
jgi:hypothetical protein